MENNNFKYGDILENIPDCPPFHYEEKEGAVFRFVQEDPAHPGNFSPAYLLNPKRFPRKIPCAALGLSFYADKAQAKLAYFSNLAQHPNFAVSAGTRIATVPVSQADGVASEPDWREGHFGHFTFHEYLRTDFYSKMLKTEPLL